MLAINWLQELDIRRVTIELDCIAIVDGVRGVCNFVTEYGSILRSCKTLLSTLQNYAVSLSGGKQTLLLIQRDFASSQVFDCSPTYITTLIIKEQW